MTTPSPSPSTTQQPISSMSMMDIKRELMELNDSSFVFNDRDELECALRSARKLNSVKVSVGLASQEVSAAASSSSSSLASTPAAAGGFSKAASSASSDNDAEAAAVKKGSSVLPDLVSVGSASRGSSQTNSVSPSPAQRSYTNNSSSRRGGSGGLLGDKKKEGSFAAAVAPLVNEQEGQQPPPPPPPTTSLPPQASSNTATSVDLFNDDTTTDDPATTNSSANSRRLVEYFVMVSCIPIPQEDLTTTTSAMKRMSQSSRQRPPDPNRDNMNSRTKARFDVRRVHLSTSLNKVNDDDEEEYGVINTDQSSHTKNSNDNDDTDIIGHTLLHPKITARYPPTDHADQPLNLRLAQFCHPEGGTDLIHPTTHYKMPRVHHFVLTDSMGGKQYGTALTVFEEFKGADVDNSDDGTNDGGGKKKKKKQPTKKTYYAPRVLTLLSTYPYLSAFRTYLTQLYRLATTTNVMTLPIERYIQNICAEVPAPPPGAFEVQLTILGSEVRFWAPPANQPIAYVSLPFKVLFECLDIGNILFAWYTLACERKVLLVSSQLSLLTVCSEILCSLLFPMKWSHLYIPVLPRSLCPMLDAPMPYLCGISRENFGYAVEDISDETVVVDLDRNVITLGSNTPDLPPLPHNRRKKLEGTLKANAGDVFWEARNLTKADVLKVKSSGNEGALSGMLDAAGQVWEEKILTRDDAFNLAYAPGSASLEYDEDANVDLDDGSLPKQSRWDAVQEAFLRFYVSLLQDYRKFLPEDDDALQERSTWRGKDGLSDLRFQKDEFVAASPSEFQPFLEELTMSQQFDDFVTRKMHNAADAPDIKFFDQSIDAKKNRSKLKLKKKETPFLHSACAHRDLKQVKAVEPSGEGLPELSEAEGGGNSEGKYMYKIWPVSFDERLFGTPRPIPSIISAEFDRRTALRSMLRSKYGIVDESRGLGGRNRSPEVTAFILFFATFTSVIGQELSSVEQKHGTGTSSSLGMVGFGGPLIEQAVRPGSTARQSLTDLDDDMEVARTIAKAQVDLGYHTLSLMRLRKLRPEPLVYKLLIQACGRCKVTHRASRLMEMLARDGLATNSEIYTSLITAFSNDERQPSSLALYQIQSDDNMSSLSSPSNSASQHLLERKNSLKTTPSEHSSLDLISESSPSESTSSPMKKNRMKTSMSRLGVNKQVFKNAKAKSKRKMNSPSAVKKHNLKVTSSIAKQIDLGESLLESLYPSIDIDTENVCPKCATVLNDDAISHGWTPCASNEYQTKCRSCTNKFVPKFSVSCKSPSFEGSQGKGTPLYCDHLSPWVLLREMRSVVNATGGIESIIDEEFRQEGIGATLWWNMVVTFRRYKLPYIFLLQGSFHNNLILPSPSLNESMHSFTGDSIS